MPKRRGLAKPLPPASVKAQVRERDGYKCVQCGMTATQHRGIYGKILDVHRLEPGSKYTLEGCVTLCKACHASQPRRRRGQTDAENKIANERLAVHVDRKLLRLAKMVAYSQGLTLRQLIDSIVGPGIVERYDAWLAAGCPSAKITIDQLPPGA